MSNSKGDPDWLRGVTPGQEGAWGASTYLAPKLGNDTAQEVLQGRPRGSGARSWQVRYGFMTSWKGSGGLQPPQHSSLITLIWPQIHSLASCVARPMAKVKG